MFNNNGAKPAAEGQQDYPQLIFKAEVILLPNGKKDISFICKTSHIPTLDNISKELDYYIIELRAMHKAQQAKNKMKIITKGPIMGLSEFLRRKRR